MSNAGGFHSTAMAYIDMALRERRLGNEDVSLNYFEQALELELSAIELVEDRDGLSWGVLHRSAGWLALNCGRPSLARELVKKGLANCFDGSHSKIVAELHELEEEIVKAEG